MFKNPLDWLAELVTGDQTVGGVKFVAEHNIQLLAQSGQLSVREFVSQVTVIVGNGTSTSTGAEYALLPHALYAATL